MRESLKKKILELYEEHGEIQIKCQAAATYPIDVILDFQKGLKKRSEKNLIKLITSIFMQGFCAPFFIWEHAGDNFCLDGHGRLEAILAIREAGVEIPALFPVAFIQAETEQEAREKLLVITSQYGEFDLLELDSWFEGITDDIDKIIRLTDDEIIRITEEDKKDFKTEKMPNDKPFKNVHVLLSMSQDDFYNIKDQLTEMIENNDIDYEQSQN